MLKVAQLPTPSSLLLSLQDVQVPVCPLCNTPVPVRRGEMPDVVVGEHIDRDCKSDPAQRKRKVGTVGLCRVSSDTAWQWAENNTDSALTQADPGRVGELEASSGLCGGCQGSKVVMEWGWAATWDVRMVNCMLLLGKCSCQLATPSCQEMKLLQGAGPAGIQPGSSWMPWVITALVWKAGVPGQGTLSPAVHSVVVETPVYGDWGTSELLMSYLKKVFRDKFQILTEDNTDEEGWSVLRT